MLDTMDLLADLKEKARRELNENEETRPAALKELRETFRAKYPELVSRDDDAFLIRFLRARKFNIERAVLLLYNYEKFHRENPALFAPLTPAEIAACANTNMEVILPTRDKNGCTVIVISARRMRFNETVTFELFSRFGLMLMELLSDDPYLQVNGMVMLEDLSGFSLSLAHNMKSDLQKKIMAASQDAYPCRFKGIHAINPPWYMSLLNSIVRPFISAKLASRLCLYGSDRTKLFEHFGKENLPLEYGGTLASFDPWACVRDGMPEGCVLPNLYVCDPPAS